MQLKNMVDNIRQLRKAAFSNMCNLCIKELFIVVSIVTISLNRKATFSEMCDLCMKDLLTVMSIVTIRLNGKRPSPTCAITV